MDDRERRDEIGGVLEERLALAMSRLRASAQAAAEITHARDMASDDDEHDPEGEPLSVHWTRARALVADAERDVAELHEAQERLAAGTYGVCTVCGGEIAAGRLEALPFARSCISCAQ